MSKNVFSIMKRINFYNCGRDGLLKLSSYLAWCAEIAGFHLDSRGIFRSKMLEEGQVFLISRVAVRFFKRPAYEDECIMSTWEHAVSGVRFIRGASLETPKGEPLVQSATDWMLVDPAQRKVIKPSQYRYENSFSDKELLVLPEKFRLPQLPHKDRLTVPPSCIDFNGHMNNSVYGDVIFDHTPGEYCGRGPSQVQIHYISEALERQVIDIHAGPVETGGYGVCGYIDGKHCFEALVSA